MVDRDFQQPIQPGAQQSDAESMLIAYSVSEKVSKVFQAFQHDGP
jgi:hypothetical protein